MRKKESIGELGLGLWLRMWYNLAENAVIVGQQREENANEALEYPVQAGMKKVLKNTRS